MQNVEITTMAVGIATALITQFAKKLNGVPITEGQTARIRTLAVVLAGIGTVLTAWANGELASASFTQFIGMAVQTIASYFVAHITYKSVIKDPNLGR